jgi:hypothetical protein
VFRHGTHLSTAFPVDDLDSAETERLLRRRAEEARWLAEQQRAAARRRKQTFEVMTGPGPAPRSSRPSGPAAALEQAGLDDEDISKMASRSLVDHGAVPAHMTRPNPKGGAR